jgi:hypothetical protein
MMSLLLIHPKITGYIKIKQSLYRLGEDLRALKFEVTEFPDSRHVKVVRLSDLDTGRFYPQKISLVLVAVKV